MRRNRLDLLLPLIAMWMQLLLVDITWAHPFASHVDSSSMSDRLLSLLRAGLYPSKSDEKSSSSRSDSLKKVLEFLSNKVDSPNKKLSASALQELSALTSGTAKTPRPIDLNKDDPAEAVMKYFHDLGITDEHCQQRTICELLTEPQASYGVFGELINYVFGNEEASQSMKKLMTDETYKQMYRAAENGRQMNDCSKVYSKCSSSYKEYIKLVTA